MFLISLPLFYVGIPYLIGSIPFGLVLTKLFTNIDLRQIGSGNIGATNVLRTGRKDLAAATLVLDSSKGALAVAYMYAYTHFASQGSPLASLSFEKETLSFTLLLAGFFAMIGHCYPVWLKFKGGKGIATTGGTLLAAVPFAGLIGLATWLVCAFITKISSLSALISAIIVPFAVFFIYGTAPAIICTLISALVFWKHRDNIGRLSKGEEPKISFKKKDKDAAA